MILGQFILLSREALVQQSQAVTNHPDGGTFRRIYGLTVKGIGRDQQTALFINELGSGKGDISLLLALAGADVTLVDCEADALALAGRQFGTFGLQPRTVVADLFNLDVDLIFYDTTSLHFEIDEEDEGVGEDNLVRGSAAAGRSSAAPDAPTLRFSVSSSSGELKFYD